MSKGNVTKEKAYNDVYKAYKELLEEHEKKIRRKALLEDIVKNFLWRHESLEREIERNIRGINYCSFWDFKEKRKYNNEINNAYIALESNLTFTLESITKYLSERHLEY
jgi:hypothetical protein